MSPRGVAAVLLATLAACRSPAARPDAPVASGGEVPEGARSANANEVVDAHDMLRIGAFEYALPPWWQPIEVPPLEDEAATRDYVTDLTGADTGTASTWRVAVEIWALACSRNGVFPVYLGHALRAGGAYAEAVAVYERLYALADTQGEQADWFHVYLAYEAGEVYRTMGNVAEARAWYLRAGAFAGSDDPAIEYYAERSLVLARSLLH